MSDSPGLVDFAIRLVNSALDLPDGQGEGGISHYRRTVINAHQKYFWPSRNDFWASTCYLQHAKMSSSKTDFVCTLLIYILWRDTYTKPLSSWSQFQTTTAVPQLADHKAEVRMTLGQALQNKRKYESDLKVGKRTTKKTRKQEWRWLKLKSQLLAT